MKIGLILPGFSASESDWCIPALLDLVRCLSSRVEVHVFPLRYPPSQRPYRIGRANVHPQAGGVVEGAWRGSLLARSTVAVVAEHRRGRFDALHAFWSDEPGLVAVAASSLTGVPAIVSLAGGELVGFPDVDYGGQLSAANRWMTRVALRRAARVTAGSTYLADIARRWHVGERLTLLPLGVDPRLFNPSGLPSEPAPFDRAQINLLSVASLVPIKRHVDLLSALPCVVRAVPDLHLHLVGDGPLRDDLRCRVAALGLTGHVSFHGAVSHDRLPGYYRAADLCVLASRHEAQAMVTLEAAACGKPTVGTRVGIIPDLGSAAVAVPLEDPGALARSLIEVASRERLRAELGQRSLQLVRSRYTVEHVVDDLEALYRCVVAERRASGRARVSE